MVGQWKGVPGSRQLRAPKGPQLHLLPTRRTATELATQHKETGTLSLSLLSISLRMISPPKVAVVAIGTY